MTAWENQSLNVEVYILFTMALALRQVVKQVIYLARELTPSFNIPVRSRRPVLRQNSVNLSSIWLRDHLTE